MVRRPDVASRVAAVITRCCRRRVLCDADGYGVERVTASDQGPSADREDIVVAVVRIRQATAAEAPALEVLQRRSSDVWEEYRDQLAANPDAIELPGAFIDNGWVQVAVDDGGAPIGFSVVIPVDDGVRELDGLFVEPDLMLCGVGRALVEDAAARASGEGARCLEVTAGPAQGFYERVGFRLVGSAQTRFGPAARMRRTLRGDRRDVGW